MSACPSNFSNFPSVFGRLSREELLEIGQAFIHQSRTVAHTPQQHTDQPNLNPYSPIQNQPLRPPHTTIPSHPPPPTRQAANQQPPMKNLRPLMEQQPNSPIPTSTPRRPAGDSFDNDTNSRKRIRNNNHSPRTRSDQQLQPQEPRFQALSMKPKFNLNILRRAISDLLPCFFICFETMSGTNSDMSCTQVAILLKKVFLDNQLNVIELSMCIKAGDNRFKFAVNNQCDFLTLYNWSWPPEIDQMKVEVVKPRTLPDSLAMVVRYIPMDIKIELAKREIAESIPAAVSFSVLSYPHRQRPTYDIRFCVLDHNEYQTALELGRIAIGQHYLPITPFLSGYKLTYCTACWQLGHVRNQCRSPVLCRKCLTPFIDGVKHFCADNSVRCAQCNGNHTSINSSCPVNKAYKQELKIAVDQTLANGTIKRTIQHENENTLPPTLLKNMNNFPLLPATQGGGRNAWQAMPSRQQSSNDDKVIQELTSMIKSLTESSNRIEKNINEVTKQNKFHDKRNELNRKCIHAIINSLLSISKWIQASNSEKTNMKKHINKSIEDLQNWKQQLSPEKGVTMRSTNESPQPVINNNNNNAINSTTTNNNTSTNVNNDRLNLEEDPSPDPSS